jgi:hypothetical protein
VVEIAFVSIEIAAVVMGDGVFRIECDGLAESGKRFLKIVFILIGKA